MTHPATLPTQTDHLEILFVQVSLLASKSKSILTLLRDAEERPDFFPPVTVIATSVGNGFALTWAGTTPLCQINYEVQSVTALALPILTQMDLNATDEKHILQLAASSKREGDGRGQSPDLSLVDVLRREREEISDAVRDGDRLRLGVLVRVVEKLADAAEILRRRLDLKIHPPTVIDRVAVDRKKGQVVVDGRHFDLRDNHATLFFYLVAANGNPVSGGDIADREGLLEFKVSKFLDQIKKDHPDLRALIKKEKRPNGRHYIELTPLQ